jgi:hypothetical protein
MVSFVGNIDPLQSGRFLFRGCVVGVKTLPISSSVTSDDLPNITLAAAFRQPYSVEDFFEEFDSTLGDTQETEIAGHLRT